MIHFNKFMYPSWVVLVHNYGRVIWHNGLTGGFSSLIGILPARNQFDVANGLAKLQFTPSHLGLKTSITLHQNGISTPGTGI